MYGIWAEHELDTFHTGMLLLPPEDPFTTWAPPAESDRFDTPALAVQNLDAGEGDAAPPTWVFADDPFVEGPSSNLIASVSSVDNPLVEVPVYVPPIDDTTDLGEIVVTGEVGPWWFNGTRPPNVGGGGSGGGGSYDQAAMAAFHQNRQWDDCEDRRADTLAEQINREIQQKADRNRVEYGAIIWRDVNGDLQRTALLTGDNRSVTGFSQPPNMIGFSDWSQVVAYVHSHPTEFNVAGTQTWLPVPDTANFDQPSRGDWRTADFYIGFQASLQNFSVYVSYNVQIKEFDSRHNVLESRDVNVPAGGSGTESGDYRPGTGCS